MSLLFKLIRIFLINAWIFIASNVHSAGESLSFVVTVPWNAIHGETKIPAGRYVVVIEDSLFRGCNLYYYLDKKIANKEADHASNKGLTAKTPGLCIKDDHVVSSAMVESFSSKDEHVFLVYFETPDRELNKTLVIVSTLRREP